VFDYISPIYFVILYNKTGMSHLKCSVIFVSLYYFLRKFININLHRPILFALNLLITNSVRVNAEWKGPLLPQQLPFHLSSDRYWQFWERSPAPQTHRDGRKCVIVSCLQYRQALPWQRVLYGSAILFISVLYRTKSRAI